MYKFKVVVKGVVYYLPTQNQFCNYGENSYDKS